MTAAKSIDVVRCVVSQAVIQRTSPRRRSQS